MLTKELVRELFDYNPETGVFTHKVRGVSHFSNEGRASHWNERFSGKRACSKKNDSGYLFLSIYNKKYRAHRIAWLYMTGDIPRNQIDHKNGVRDDNRWCNLRHVTNSDNGKNQKRKSTNTSGVTGVWFSKQKKKWVAEILVNYKKIHIGTFSDIGEAAKARKDAEREYGFHENHGRVAP